MEIYTKIDFYPEYEVSNLGKVRNVDSKQEVEAYKLKNGYLGVRLNSKLKHVHRLVAEAFLPNQSNLPQVNHKNLNKLDNSVANLEWISSSNNIRHSYSNNLTHGRKKLSVSEVTAIKFYWSTGHYSQAELAQEFEVAKPTVNRIIKGKRWAWLSEVAHAA